MKSRQGFQKERTQNNSASFPINNPEENVSLVSPKEKQKDNNIIQDNSEEQKKVKKVKKGLFAILQKEYQRQMGVQPAKKSEKITEKSVPKKDKGLEQISETGEMDESDISFLSEEYKKKSKQKIKTQQEEKKAMKNSLSAIIQEEYESYMGIQSGKKQQKNPKQIQDMAKKEKQIQSPSYEKKTSQKNQTFRSKHTETQEQKSSSRKIYHTVAMRQQTRLKTEQQPQKSIATLNLRQPKNSKHIKSEEKQKRFSQINSQPRPRNYNHSVNFSVEESFDQKKNDLSKNNSSNMFPSILKKNTPQRQQIKVGLSPQNKKVSFQRKPETEEKPKTFAEAYNKYDRLGVIERKMNKRLFPDALDEEILFKVKNNPNILEQKSKNLTETQKKQYLQRAAEEVRAFNFSSSLKNRISHLRNHDSPPEQKYKNNVYSPLYSYLS